MNCALSGVAIRAVEVWLVSFVSSLACLPRPCRPPNHNGFLGPSKPLVSSGLGQYPLLILVVAGAQLCLVANTDCLSCPDSVPPRSCVPILPTTLPVTVSWGCITKE